MDIEPDAQAPPAAYFKPPARALTPREREVLELLVAGNTNKLIAKALKRSIKTVEKHRQSLMNHLDIHHITGLTRYAIATGISRVPAPIALD